MWSGPCEQFCNYGTHHVEARPITVEARHIKYGSQIELSSTYMNVWITNNPNKGCYQSRNVFYNYGYNVAIFAVGQAMRFITMVHH